MELRKWEGTLLTKVRRWTKGGEPDAVKVASPVRWGAWGDVPLGNAPCAYPIKAVHGECSVELAKWTFPIIVSFSREPYEVESLTYGSNGGHEETYRKATRLVPTQWRRAVR